MYLENDRIDRSEELLTIVESIDYNAYWHLPRVFNPDNYFGDSENIFGNFVSINVLCVPKETKMEVNGLRQVLSAQEKWNELQR